MLIDMSSISGWFHGAALARYERLIARRRVTAPTATKPKPISAMLTAFGVFDGRCHVGSASQVLAAAVRSVAGAGAASAG